MRSETELRSHLTLLTIVSKETPYFNEITRIVEMAPQKRSRLSYNHQKNNNVQFHNNSLSRHSKNQRTEYLIVCQRRETDTDSLYS